MVSASNDNNEGDGIRRDVIYAKWRTDKAPDKGFSADLMHHEIPVESYDDLEKLPILRDSNFTSILDVFLK